MRVVERSRRDRARAEVRVASAPARTKHEAALEGRPTAPLNQLMEAACTALLLG